MILGRCGNGEREKGNGDVIMYQQKREKLG